MVLHMRDLLHPPYNDFKNLNTIVSDEEFAPYAGSPCKHIPLSISNGVSPSACPRDDVPQIYQDHADNLSDISAIPNTYVNSKDGVG